MAIPLNVVAEELNIQFLREKHIKYCKRFLGVLPEKYESLDSTRTVTTFFAVATLDHLNALDTIEEDKQELIDWIYSMQVTSNEDSKPVDFGFRNSVLCMPENKENSDVYDKAHIAMTYAALASLIILGDDLSRVDRENILHSLTDLQLPNGSFRPMNIDCENDMRFIYCAACICYILQDWSHIDVEKAVDYIRSSRSYDGGIGQGPELESHGGSTFCAIAALSLMGKLESTFTVNELKDLRRWLAFRQVAGYHGRPNKPDDTCYSFWVGATLKILDCYEFVNYPELLKYVLGTQDNIIGGLSKWTFYFPDVLHTFLGITGLLLQDNGAPLVHPALNISHRAYDHLLKIHKQWAKNS